MAESAESRQNMSARRLFYIKPSDWTWWAWTTTVVLLGIGLSGYPQALVGAMLVTIGQGAVLLARDRSPMAFSVQLRVAYLLLLLVSYPPGMRWLYWLPAIGTFVLVVFGYCLLARCLSLLPWNSSEPYTLDRLRRTFLSRPDLGRVTSNPMARSCAGGLCTIEAQVAPAAQRAERHAPAGRMHSVR